MRISCIVLAGGLSSRFGGNKLLAKWEGKSLLEWTLGKVTKMHFHQVILVTTEQITSQITPLPGLDVVINAYSSLGISHSIALGISACSDAQAYLFLVADQPLLSSETLLSFIKGFETSGKGLGCVAYNNQLGNPTLFCVAYKEALLGLEGDVGGKSILRTSLDDCWVYQVEEASELKDIDTLKDYEQICKYRVDEV